MDLRRVGMKDDAVEITYAEKGAGAGKTDVTTVIVSKDTPSPAFTEAMAAMVAPAIALLELPKKYGDGASFRALAVSEHGDTKGFVVSLLKPIDATNAPFNISTPHIGEGHRDEAGVWVGCPEDLQDAISDLLEVAERFARGGERQQVDLFEGGEDEHTEEADVEDLERAAV